MPIALNGCLLRVGSAPRCHHSSAVTHNANRARFPGDIYGRFVSACDAPLLLMIERLPPA